MKKLVVFLSVLSAVAAAPARAEEPTRRFLVAPYVGGLIFTGHRQDHFDDAPLVGVTGSVDLHRYVAVVGSLGWAYTRGSGFAPRRKDVEIYLYDLGVQGQLPLPAGDGRTLKLFAGAGAGGRTYRPRSWEVDRENDFAWYVALGASLELRRLVLSVTVRDYMSEYDGIGPARARSLAHDLAPFASVGVRF